MIDYCKCDVALLKAGCEAFQQEFERQAGFNPMAKCITIASTCNLYWRKHHLTPNTIVVEPLGGWRGAKVHQSLKALQWLYYQEQQIPKQGASADRIRHIRNGGEQSIRTIVDSYFVDRYRLRVSWLSLSWLSPLLSQQASQALCSAGQKRRRTVSSNSIQTHGPALSGLHSHRNVGVRMGPIGRHE